MIFIKFNNLIVASYFPLNNYLFSISINATYLRNKSFFWPKHFDNENPYYYKTRSSINTYTYFKPKGNCSVTGHFLQKTFIFALHQKNINTNINCNTWKFLRITYIFFMYLSLRCLFVNNWEKKTKFSK